MILSFDDDNVVDDDDGDDDDNDDDGDDDDNDDDDGDCKEEHRCVSPDKPPLGLSISCSSTTMFFLHLPP